MNQTRIPLPPPWCLILFGAVFLYWAYEHYVTMVEFEEGLIDSLYMYWFMIALYEAAGFWPTVILPFVAAGAVALAGIGLQIRDLRYRAQGTSSELSYQPVRWKGLLTALAVVTGTLTALIGIALLLKN